VCDDKLFMPIQRIASINKGGFYNFWSYSVDYLLPVKRYKEDYSCSTRRLRSFNPEQRARKNPGVRDGDYLW